MNSIFAISFGSTHFRLFCEKIKDVAASSFTPISKVTVSEVEAMEL